MSIPIESAVPFLPSSTSPDPLRFTATRWGSRWPTPRNLSPMPKDDYGVELMLNNIYEDNIREPDQACVAAHPEHHNLRRLPRR
jgi:hypothetical protein